jgi:hypothetical protein
MDYHVGVLIWFTTFGMCISSILDKMVGGVGYSQKGECVEWVGEDLYFQ